MVKRNDTVNPNEEISNLNVTGYTCGHVLGTDCFFQVDFSSLCEDIKIFVTLHPP